jgi:RNA 3'-terminal phosphate cyclase (ATP)
MREQTAVVVLDGSQGEGGGAMVRTALAMAALTEQAVLIESVRGGTSHPGVDAEDVVFAAALTKSCEADVSGLELGSSTLRFSPKRRPRALDGELPSVRNSQNRGASVPILFAGLIPVLARTGAYSVISATGETYGNHALGFDALDRQISPALRRFGIYAFPSLESAGFGRESRGQAALEVEPSAVRGIEWTDRGRLVAASAVVAYHGLPPQVAERGASHLRKLAESANVKMEIERVPCEGDTPGIHVTCTAQYERGFGSGAAMGMRGIRVEVLAQSSFEELFSWMRTDATVDPFLTDHLLLPAVLAEESSTWKVSRLTKRFMTMVWVVKQFAPIHITVRGTEDGPGTVTVRRA